MGTHIRGLCFTILCLMLLNLSPGLLFDDSLGELLPNDPQGVVDEFLYMTCTLNLDHTAIDHNYNASDLYFNVSGREVRGAPGVRVLNETTVLLVYRLDITQGRSFIECVLDTETDRAYIGQQYLFVGYRPFNMTLDEVYVLNWRKLIFKVQKKVNPKYKTKVDLEYKLSYEPDSAYTRCNRLTESTDSPGYISCEAEDFGEKYITSQDQNLYVSIRANAYNAVGETETLYEFLVNDKVKPDRVRDVRVMPYKRDPRTLLVMWNGPKDGYRFSVNITYSDEWTGQSKHVASTDHRVLLRNLEPFTMYTVSLVCTSIHGGFPSDPVTIATRTLATVPAAQPRLTNGSFVSQPSSDTKRNITIYWQSVDQRYLQGELVLYIITLIWTNSDGFGTYQSLEVSKTNTRHTIQGLDRETKYRFYVKVKNSAGINTTTTQPVMTVPKQSVVADAWAEDVPIVLANNDTTLTVQFDFRKNQGKEVKFFWCIKGSESEVQFRTLQSKLTLVEGLSETFKNHIFGYGSATSGINWEVQVYDLRIAAKKPDIVSKSSHEDSVLVRLVESTELYQGYAVKYRLVWCPADRDQECPDDSPSKFVSRAEAKHVEISGLDPGTEYLIEGQSYTEDGGKSMYNTVKVHTNPLSPGLAPGYIVLIAVAAVIVIVGVIFGICCCTERCRKFLGAKIGKPDLPDEVQVKTEKGDKTDHSGAASPLIDETEPNGVNIDYAVVNEERPATDGQSVIEAFQDIETDSDYSDSNYTQGNVLGSAESGYDPAHVPDNTKPYKLSKRPPHTYTTDHSHDKNPLFLFGSKNKVPADTVPVVARVFADGCGQPDEMPLTALNPKPENKTKKLKSKRDLNSAKKFTNPTFSNKSPESVDFVGKKVYDRGDSTDSASSAGRYAPTKLSVEPFIQENSTSNGDTSGSDAPDYATVHPPKEILCSKDIVPVDTSLVNAQVSDCIPKNADSFANSKQINELIASNIPDTHTKNAKCSSESSQSDSGIEKNDSINSAAPDDDGLEWDSSDDENKPYNKRRAVMKEVYDEDNADQIDTDVTSNETEEDEEAGSEEFLGVKVLKRESDAEGTRKGDALKKCDKQREAETKPKGNSASCANDSNSLAPKVEALAIGNANSVQKHQNSDEKKPCTEDNNDVSGVPANPSDNTKGTELVWDSDDDSVGNNYTRNKTEVPKMVYDSNEEDFPEPQDEDEMSSL